jgi:Holliday junction resolvase RusA-like endonuclease
MTNRLRFLIVGPPVSGKNHMQIRKNRKTGGRFIAKSDAAAAWIVQAAGQLTEQRLRSRVPTFRESVRVTCDVYQTAETPDLDNVLTACGDAMQKAGVVEDDALIHEWCARKFVVPADPRVEITVTATEDPQWSR